MALTKCRECKKEISKKADKCPHCGAPNKRTSFVTWVIAVLMGAALLIFIVGEIDKLDQPVNAKYSETLAIDASPEAQESRVKLMKKLQETGILYKAEASNNVAKMYISPGFYQLNIDDKKTFANVVYTYFLAGNKSIDVMVIRDSKTGKDIGKFSKYGLDLY